MSKHTPGPWLIDELAETQEPDFYGAPGDPNGYHAISTAGWRMTGFIGDANAKLIAAVPELLEALQMLVQYSDFSNEAEHADFSRQLEKSRAVIAKATT
jgi:hypothetical protein